jgi:hypothetical protein
MRNHTKHETEEKHRHDETQEETKLFIASLNLKAAGVFGISHKSLP